MRNDPISFFPFFAEESELQINAIIAAQTERYKLFICLWGLSQATLTRFCPLLTTYLTYIHITLFDIYDEIHLW